jgi:hypothetical protein
MKLPAKPQQGSVTAKDLRRTRPIEEDHLFRMAYSPKGLGHDLLCNVGVPPHELVL